MKQITESKIEELLAAAKQAKASQLTLCIDAELQWAIEPSTSWLPNQLCRVVENYSAAGLREFLNESFAAKAAWETRENDTLLVTEQKIRTWKQLDEAIRASGNRMFYVSFYENGAALKMDNGRVITEKLSDAVAHMQES